MSASMCSGIAAGSASTRSSRVTCWTTPPTFEPGASPMSCTTTVAWIGWSSRTSWKSTCVSVPRIGCCWYSFSTAWCGVFWPSITTSTIACSPDGPVSAVAEVALADDDRARVPLAVEDTGDQPLPAEAAHATGSDLVGRALGDLQGDAIARHRRTMVAEGPRA